MNVPDPDIENLKDRGWRQIAEIDKAFADGRIDEERWHQAMAALITPSYLAAATPYAQAGHSGDAASWEASRGFVVQAIHRSGTFLDAGCASGILMETVQVWAASKGLAVEPYGLEIVPELAALAGRRLPQWSDRIHIGNIRTWRPEGNRFGFVLIRPEYAPRPYRAKMVRHVLDHVLASDGRLIVFVGAEEKEQHRAEQDILEEGMAVAGRVEIPHPRDNRVVRRLFWLEQ